MKAIKITIIAFIILVFWTIVYIEFLGIVQNDYSGVMVIIIGISWIIVYSIAWIQMISWMKMFNSWFNSKLK
jgi:hypothetical protein